MTFMVPRGRHPLVNDRRVTVSIPAGTISEVGLSTIRSTLLQQSVRTWDPRSARPWVDLAHAIPTLGDQWKTDEGTYTKRLSKLAYEKWGLKVPPAVLSAVGNHAQTHAVGANYRIEVTRDLNRPASEFGHRGSCWWTYDYYKSRCAAKTNGVFGLRTFRFRSVIGRAWVLPLRIGSRFFKPTFDALDADAFMVFNGYGNLEGAAPARVMAQMTGLTYKKVGFSARPMYVNNDSGYLVGPSEIIEHQEYVRLDLKRHATLYPQEVAA
jgi:hypothetical protein